MPRRLAPGAPAVKWSVGCPPPMQPQHFSPESKLSSSELSSVGHEKQGGIVAPGFCQDRKSTSSFACVPSLLCHQLVQQRSSPRLQLVLAGFSVAVTRKFLLLVPHNTPMIDEPAYCDALTHGIWNKWPVPHPVAYLGGPIICPRFRRQWTEHDDKQTGERPVAYAASVDIDPDQLDFPLEDCAKHEQKPVQKVCIHEEAYKRPLDVLRLFTLRLPQRRSLASVPSVEVTSAVRSDGGPGSGRAESHSSPRGHRPEEATQRTLDRDSPR